ncbi:MAG TPA: DUF1016 N-terminal domain-containing protein [Pirellulales bacterium]|nr:DUF1016 N-terminal domain-containing protein [Pirellulales bacterium]
MRALIQETRGGVARAVNAALVGLYWNIGKRIHTEILKERRATYGEQIVEALSRQLSVEFGRGFSRRNLFNMIRFAEVFPERQIVQALTAQLGWTHFSLIIYLDDPLRRDFYAEMCRIERWSTRTLEKKIAGMLFERTALSKKPAELARRELAALREHDKLTPDLVFRDPYFLDFLGLKDTYRLAPARVAEEETPRGHFGRPRSVGTAARKRRQKRLRAYPRTAIVVQASRRCGAGVPPARRDRL